MPDTTILTSLVFLYILFDSSHFLSFFEANMKIDRSSNIHAWKLTKNRNELHWKGGDHRLVALDVHFFFQFVQSENQRKRIYQECNYFQASEVESQMSTNSYSTSAEAKSEASMNASTNASITSPQLENSQEQEKIISVRSAFRKK